MELEEAIKHCKDVALSCTNKECALEHFQLLKWLQEYSNMLEKQGKQKSADKVEPMFAEGDWITNKEYTWKVISVGNFDYTLQNQLGKCVEDTIDYVDANFHLWTIQDAKNGDVLVTENKNIFIFKSIDNCSVYDHCRLYFGESPKLLIINSCGSEQLPTGYRPATKEQRDLLFQKMKETGYEWDAEKKILKKIENEIEIPFGAKDSELQEATYYIPKGFHAEIDGDKVVIKKDEILDKWSKDDERICQCLIRDQEKALDDVRNDKYGHSEIISDLKEMYRNRIDWLKSLKDKCISQKDI